MKLIYCILVQKIVDQNYESIENWFENLEWIKRVE